MFVVNLFYSASGTTVLQRTTQRIEVGITGSSRILRIHIRL
jgi:hypothetical protein